MARRRFVARSTNRPNYDWEGVTVTAPALLAATVAEVTMFSADSAETLVRVRGSLFACLRAVASAPEDRCVLGVGIIVAPTGATVAVSPITEAGANWLYHSFMTLDTRGVIGEVADQGAQGWQRLEVDNKAMRKLREDESIFMVVENQGIAGDPSLDFFAGIRVLTRR